jgi:hypothetical protein
VLPPSPQQPGLAEPSFDFTPSQDAADLSSSDLAALRSAARWLKAYAILGMVQLFTCGCLNDAVLRLGHLGDAPVIAVTLGIVLRLIALAIILAGAQSMDRVSSRGLALTASVVALLTSAYLLRIPGMIVLAAWRRGGVPFLRDGPDPFCVSLGLTVIVAAIGLVGGIRGLMVLNRPEVIRAFRRHP